MKDINKLTCDTVVYTINHFHACLPTLGFITLPASPPTADGPWGVKPPEPSTLPTVLAFTSVPNIHTRTQCSSLSVCPQCFQVTGWGAKWHHATKCHLVPFWCHAEPPGASRQAYVPLAWSQAHWCHAEGAGRSWHWPGFGVATLLYTLPLCLSLGAILQKCVCVLARRHK